MKIHIGHHFYGAGNLGDDLMMAGFLRAWQAWGGRGALSCAIPFDRRAQRLRFPAVEWLPYDLETRSQAIRDCTIWLGLGGPAFETDSGSWMVEHMAVDLELCQRFRKPMFFLCVGVSNRESLADPRNQAVLDYAEHIWTRDASVADQLRNSCQATKITSGADLSHLYLATQSWPDRSAGDLAWLMHFDDPAVVRPHAVAQAIADLPQWKHHWLVQEVRNLPGSELAMLHAFPAELRARLKVHLPDYNNAPTDHLLQAWPSCEVVLASRFHGALVAAWRGARVAVIERNDKLRGLVNTLGCVGIPAQYDDTALRHAVESSAAVGRHLLECQHEIAQSCCESLFQTLRPNRLAPRETRAAPPSESENQSAQAQNHFLTADEIEQFHQQGCIGPFSAFSPEEMEGPARLIQEKILTVPSPHSAYPTQLRHLDSRTIWQLCSHPAIVNRLISLYGPDLILWYSNFFDKGPARPDQEEEYPWHQDMWHWKLEPLMSLSVWLAITPATEENGCVEVIPGTHTLQIPVVQTNDAKFGSWFGGQSADPACFNEADKVAMVMQPGQFFIFNEGTLHHSNPNRTQERRIGLSFRVTLPRVKSDRLHPCLLLSGRDRFGLNPIVPPPITDPNTISGPPTLPDADNFYLNGAVNGTGWHLPELDAGIAFRWTGPEANSWLDLAFDQSGAARLRCEILHAIAPGVLKSLRVWVNDYSPPLAWKSKGRITEITGHVPATALQKTPGQVRVRFEVAETLRFCDLQATSNDTRQLGVAISRISLTPFDSLGDMIIKTLRAAHRRFPLLRPSARIVRRIAASLRPRIGNLNQYAPRPLSQFTLPPSQSILHTAPVISIVTPSFQQGSFIERTLKSVLQQNYPNLEYFVQDGGSSDQTIAILMQHEPLLAGWASGKDDGQSHAINLGFARTSGEIMAWLNADDVLLPGALACVADYFSRHPDVDVVYGNRLLIDEDDSEIGRWILPGHDDDVLSWADYVPQETLFWRRSLWEKTGGRIDESFSFAMDWDLLIRFREAGAHFAHLPYFLAAFRVHPQQKTSAAIDAVGSPEMDRVRARIHGRVPHKKEIRRAVLPFLAKQVAADMAYRLRNRG